MRRAGAVLLFLILFFLVVPAGVLPAYLAPETRLVLLGTVHAPPLPADLPILERYDAFVLAEVPVGDLPALQQRYEVDLLPARTTISLNGASWDTARGEPAVAAELRAAPDDPYFLVQFYGPVKDEWVRNLEAMGVSFLGYHPSFTYIVRMDPAIVSSVRAAHAVQWVGPYHPAYRLAAAAEMEQAMTYQGRLALDVRAFPGEDLATLRHRLEEVGGTVEFLSTAGAPFVRVWATAEQLPRLAALPGVYRVEPYVTPQLHNDKAAQVMRTWDVWRSSRNGLLQDLMGAGQVAGAVDSGLDNNTTSPTIEDFYDYTNGTATSRVAANQAGAGCGVSLCYCNATDDADQGGHGTHVSGSIVGNGYNALAQRGLTAQARSADPSFDYAWAVGQAPEARIAFAHVAGRLLGLIPYLCMSNIYTTWQNLYNAGARNVNNSWGGGGSTYGGTSVNADDLMWDYQDYLVLASAGNAGPAWNSLSQPSSAKNIVTVGASGNHRSVWGFTSDSAGLLVYYSSCGPVNLSGGDGRFKPDVVAPGADILSTRTNYIDAATVGLWGNESGDGDGDGRPDYEWSGGTSMSAPLVTGAATVVRDYFQDIQGLGDSTPPSAALIKAALVNGAVDMGYGYDDFTTAPYGGRNMQGWGMVNVEQSITPRAPRSFFYDDSTNINAATHQSAIGFTASGQFNEYTVDVVTSSEPLKITLTWTDRQNGGDGFAVDNLDLLVTAPGGTQYRGNVFSGSWSQTGGVADTRNNTEAVYLRSPAIGTWTIRVTALSIAASTTQPYALVASGGFGPSPSFTRSDSSGRAGTSAQPYFPSLKPLGATQEHTAPGGSFTTSFRLTNWGTNDDTISLSASATYTNGNSAAGIGVVFNPSGPFDLAAGASTTVQATISVGGVVARGPYDVSITASSGGSTRRDVLASGLNVIPNGDLSNETRVVSAAAAQYAQDFWGAGTLLWTVFLSATNHVNSEMAVWTTCSADGGQSWTNVGRVDSGSFAYYHPPAIAGRADGSSVTVIWTQPNTTIHLRTWTRTSGCTGTWGAIQSVASYSGSTWRIGDQDVIYDNDGTVLAIWRAYDYQNTVNPEGVMYTQSSDAGTSWTTVAGVPDASGSDLVHAMPQLTLDTNRNDVWMAYANNTNGRDIYLKRWSGSSNAWQSGTTIVAQLTDREVRPAIAYVAASDALWVSWQRYATFADPTARLYYARSDAGTLPSPTFGTTYGPYGTRTAELHPAMIVGDSSFTYIAYLAYSDGYRGANLILLQVPAAGGAPTQTRQVSATVDDPPLNARGNAGTPRLLWLTTTVNGLTFAGPTLLYSKSSPGDHAPDYSANLGVAPALYALGEDFDLYLAQAGNAPTAVRLTSFAAAAADGGVLLSWETASEHDNAGFHLYRSLSLDSQGERLNQALIPAAVAGGEQGASYAFLDRTAQPGVNYCYTLEDVDVSGTRTPHGPVLFTLWRAYLPLVGR